MAEPARNQERSIFPETGAPWRLSGESPWSDAGLKLLVPAMLALLLAAAYQCGSLSSYLEMLRRQSYASLLPALGAIYTLAMLGFQGLRTVLWACYRPYSLHPGPLPRLTLVIPAYNEGAMVELAVESAVASDYPQERLEIICVDDGSTDDTWSYLESAQRRHPHLVKRMPIPQT